MNMCIVFPSVGGLIACYGKERAENEGKAAYLLLDLHSYPHLSLRAGFI